MKTLKTEKTQITQKSRVLVFHLIVRIDDKT